MAKKDTKEQFAAMLNGREYREELTSDDINRAAESGLVVVLGRSDDICSLYGAVDDELDCYNGGRIALANGGVLRRQCDDEECPHEAARFNKAKKLEIIWVDEHDGPCWKYDVPFDAAKFMVFDDGDEYCEGIVFDVADIDK